MVLFIGGATQGKSEYVRENYTDCAIIDNLNSLIRDLLNEGKSEDEIIELVMDDINLKEEHDEEVVVISDEIGNGIVPIDKKEREFRDIVGHTQICIAKKADKVFRVMCGIPVQIK